MSENAGVYVRLQNTSGVLWSSSRPDHAAVVDDLNDAFGPEVADAILASLKSGFVTVQAAPQLSVVPTAVPDSDEEAIQRAEAIMQQAAAAPLVVNTEPAPQFDACEICGTPKDQWKPPGVSKNNKKYPGFFGCPNFRNHP